MSEEPPPRDLPPLRIPVEDSLDLHAFSPRDVPSAVEEYLFEAVSKGFREVRLIHGKGTGFQREAVRAVLARHPLVASYSDASAGSGGWGATQVVLRLNR